VPAILLDNEGAACGAVRHLIAGGHRRIAMLSGRASICSAVSRRWVRSWRSRRRSSRCKARRSGPPGARRLGRALRDTSRSPRRARQRGMRRQLLAGDEIGVGPRGCARHPSASAVRELCCRAQGATHDRRSHPLPWRTYRATRTRAARQESAYRVPSRARPTESVSTPSSLDRLGWLLALAARGAAGRVEMDSAWTVS
jgi:hypothetical protein